MSFQTPLTIKQTLARIEERGYVLPAIQREFVWKPEQVINLLDSLMRGYPVGSFLFWRVEKANSLRFRFYDFVLNFHERDAPHCPPHDLTTPRDLTAVLDGQQRLTSLNIAFRGTMAVKEKYKRTSSPDAYPQKRLHLNLSRPAEENADGRLYDFRFLSVEEASDEEDLFYPLGDTLRLGDAGPSIFNLLAEHGLDGDTQAFAFGALYRLYEVVHKDKAVSHYLEEQQDLERVLNIFIRVNSGATKLSYSDLLMSIAAGQWSDDDARVMVHGLVKTLNATGEGFDLSKDFVLKAGLMLSDIASVGFKVENFNQENMAKLLEEWDAVSRTLTRTVCLAADLGLQARSLTADSALLPIAYFLHRRDIGDAFLKAAAHRHEREAIGLFLRRSLLKSGVWGSGLDVTLTALRKALKEHAGEPFPAAALESVLAARGRSLRFGAEEIDGLLDVAYGDKRVVPLLSVLFPHVDLRQHFHVDHVYPRSHLTPARLRRSDLNPDAATAAAERRDLLPNLQLLEGAANLEKADRAPAGWLAAHHPDAVKRQRHLELHLLGEVPADACGFAAFFAARREALRKRLMQKLGDGPPEP